MIDLMMTEGHVLPSLAVPGLSIRWHGVMSCRSLQHLMQFATMVLGVHVHITVAINVNPNLALPLCRLVSAIDAPNGRDHMLQHNVSQQEVIRGSREQKMKDLVFDIASEANLELETVPF